MRWRTIAADATAMVAGACALRRSSAAPAATTGNCSPARSGCVGGFRHGGPAAPRLRPARADVDLAMALVAAVPARLDEPRGPASRRACSRLRAASVPPAMYSAGASVRPGLGAQGEGGGKIARTFERERVHGSASLHRARCGSRILDRQDDVVVGAAAAEIAAHPFTDLLWRSRHDPR